MLKTIYAKLVVTMLLMSIWSWGFNIQPARASGTIYIRADGGVDPPTAPIQRNGDIYSLTGDIVSATDGIVIERDSVTLDGKSNSVQGTEARTGIDFSYRRNVTIENTIVIGFAEGILMDYSSSNTLYGNTILNNGEGIHMWESSNNTLSSNNMSGNRYNFGISGWELSHYLHTIDTSNLVNGKHVYYLKDQENLLINPSTHPQIGYLALINSNKVRIENLILTGNVDGLLLANTNDSMVTNNTLRENMYGISLSCSSNNNTLFGNNIADTEYGGVYLRLSSNGNTLSDNTITNSGYGIFLYVSSHQNNIAGNNLINNGYGIYLSETFGNRLYHNNFRDNAQQVYSNDSANSWDYDYPSGGNYWSDHNPLDEDKDKIGDAPYVIDENNTDRYPLIYPFECYEPGYVCSPDLNKDGIVNIVDVSKVARAFGCKPGDSYWNAIADMDLDELINIIDVSIVAKDFGKQIVQLCEVQPPWFDFGRVYDGSRVEASCTVLNEQIVGLKSRPTWIEIDKIGGDWLSFSLNTSRVGNYSDCIIIETTAGDARVDVKATVRSTPTPSLKMLVLDTPFDMYSTGKPEVWKTMTDVMDAGFVNVSYVSSLNLGDYDPDYNLSALNLGDYDIVLLAEGGLNYVGANVDYLRNYVKNGGCLIVCADSFYVSSISKANLILKEYGMSIRDEEYGFEVFITDFAEHAVTAGVNQLRLLRPSPVEIVTTQAVVLARPPDTPQNEGVLAIWEQGEGKVIALGDSLWWYSTLYYGKDYDNPRIFLNIFNYTRTGNE